MNEDATAMGRLKQLNAQVNTLEVKANELKAIINSANQKLEQLNKKLDPLKAEARLLRIRASEKGVGVSDHAVLQYLVRRDGLELRRLKTDIVQAIKPQIDAVEATKGVKDIIVDDWVYRYDAGTNCIITIIKYEEGFIPVDETDGAETRLVYSV